MAKRDQKTPSFKLRIFTGDLRQPILGLFVGLFGLAGVLYIINSQAHSVSPSIIQASLHTAISEDRDGSQTISWGDRVSVTADSIGYDRLFDARGYSMSMRLVCSDSSGRQKYFNTSAISTSQKQPPESASAAFLLSSKLSAPATCAPSLWLYSTAANKTTWTSVWPNTGSRESPKSIPANPYKFTVK